MSEFIKKHKKGIIGTIIFHAIIVTVFILFGYSTPLPLPGEEGILINFGEDDQGIGQFEPQVSKSAQQKPVQESQESVEESTPPPSDEGSVTQDFEEAPAVKEQGKKEETEEVKKETETETKEEKTEEKKEEQEVKEQGLFPDRDRKNEESTNEGNTEGQGNQGALKGSPESDNYSDLNSSGNEGLDYSLEGRNPESLPKPEYNYQIEGKVVVEITVDKYGNVTDANPGVKGSTTLEANLLTAAKKAALKAKFDRKPDAPAYQKGTITYYFRLQ